ncbi:Afadin and alpha-actinin-binding-domain-containing protein [Mycena floridula]|nr:Afadin and alpha-actinin-binding-domain-containing protein [Mycena floridula]
MSSESMVATSSLDFINAQLVSHGFAPAPGVCLDGVSNTNLDRVVKTLLDMLGQRVKDMSRTEELATEVRTLRYEQERLSSMYRTATEKAAKFEGDMNLHKAQLAAVSRSLTASQNDHKDTMNKLQRANASIQALRTTHQNELKKKEKEVDQMAQKWNKLADIQVKLTTTPSGIQSSNGAIVDGTEVIIRGPNFLEVALEQAEKARAQLFAENAGLRRMVLTAVNETQGVVCEAKRILLGKSDEPTPFTLSTLFPLASGFAQDQLHYALDALRGSLAHLSPSSAPTSSKSTASAEELERLNAQEAASQAAETQAVFDKYMKDHRMSVGYDAANVSVDLMTATVRDEELDRLATLRKQLDEERHRFTEATITLGKERANLEAERVRLKEEKRSWQVDLMLAELPPTPETSATLSPPKKKSPKKSPRKQSLSPKPVNVGKAGAGRKTRIARRSSVTPPKSLSFTPLTASLLPTSFVLPPPSPQTSLPSQPALLISSIAEPIISPSEEQPIAGPSILITPASSRPFPGLKPFGQSFPQRIIHAYSPAKPSPLSRILMLGNSPPAFPGSDSGLGPLVESDGEGIEDMFPEMPPAPPEPQMSLAQELGIPESPPETPQRPESPLREKKMLNTGAAKGRALAKDNRKEKVVSVPTTSRVKQAIEKENGGLKKKIITASRPKQWTAPAPSRPAKPVAKPAPSATMAASRARLVAKLTTPAGGSGPRRVPIGSAEAPSNLRKQS